jgi:hypothetical protein
VQQSVWSARRRVILAIADEPLCVEVRGTALEVFQVPANHEEFDRTDEGYPYLGYSVRIGNVCVHP